MRSHSLWPLPSKGPRDPDPSSFPISPYPFPFYQESISHVPKLLSLSQTELASWQDTPLNHHPRTPNLPHPPPNSLLTTASSWGAWSPTTSITGHLEAQCQGGGSEPWRSLTHLLPRRAAGKMSGSSDLTKRIQRQKT